MAKKTTTWHGQPIDINVMYEMEGDLYESLADLKPIWKRTGKRFKVVEWELKDGYTLDNLPEKDEEESLNDWIRGFCQSSPGPSPVDSREIENA